MTANKEMNNSENKKSIIDIMLKDLNVVFSKSLSMNSRLSNLKAKYYAMKWLTTVFPEKSSRMKDHLAAVVSLRFDFGNLQPPLRTALYKLDDVMTSGDEDLRLYKRNVINDIMKHLDVVEKYFKKSQKFETDVKLYVQSLKAEDIEEKVVVDEKAVEDDNNTLSEEEEDEKEDDEKEVVEDDETNNDDSSSSDEDESGDDEDEQEENVVEELSERRKKIIRPNVYQRQVRNKLLYLIELPNVDKRSIDVSWAGNTSSQIILRATTPSIKGKNIEFYTKIDIPVHAIDKSSVEFSEYERGIYCLSFDRVLTRRVNRYQPGYSMRRRVSPFERTRRGFHPLFSFV